MKILIACEESQEVCKAMRKRGHEAYSCDIEFCSGKEPQWHIWQDVEPLLNGNTTFRTCNGERHYIEKWDMIIAFPPCTYLTKAGATNLKKNGEINEERFQKGIEAKLFFEKILNADCPRICIENPVPMKIFNLPMPTQCIQPYYFGIPVSKKTYLWLKGLPLLCPTNVIEPTYTFSNFPQFQNCNGKYRAKARSRTFTEVAEAMAESWGTTFADLKQQRS